MIEPKIVGGVIEINDTNEFIEKINRFSEPIQVMKADFVAGKNHLAFAAKKAQESFKKDPISNSLNMETLLFAVGDRQINEAIKKVGVEEGKNEVATIIYDTKNTKETINEIGLRKNNELLEINDNKIKKIKEVFDITEKEIEAVGKQKIPLLVQERIALLKINK